MSGLAPTGNTQPQPAVQPPRGSGAGCWLVAALTLFIVLVLVIIGLFLPPISLYDRLFSEQFAMLDAQNNGLASGDGAFSFAVLPQDAGQDFGVQLETVSLVDFEAADSAAGAWVPEAKNAVPYYLALQSPVYSITTTGTAPGVVTLALDLPSNAPRTLLDMYGWYGDAARWEFIPSQSTETQMIATVTRIPDRVAIFQAAPIQPTVIVSYDISQVLLEPVGQVATVVSPAGLQPNVDATISGLLAPGFSNTAGYLIMPVIRNFVDPRALDTETVSGILGNSGLRQEHARQIKGVASSNGYDGVLIDYRGLTPDQRENFSDFIRILREDLDEVGMRVGVVIPAAENRNGIWETGAYDWRALGAQVDYFQINLGIDPRAFTPADNQLVEAMLSFAVQEVNRTKVLLRLTAQSVREIGGGFTSIGYDEALSGLGDVIINAEQTETGAVVPGTEIRASLDGFDAVAGVDTLTNAPYVEYLDESGSVLSRVWLTTGDALRFRADWTVPFALGGIAFEDLLVNDLADGVLSAIIAYKTQIPAAPAPTDLVLRWRIEGTDGQIDEVVTGLNEDLVVTLTAPDGNYAVNVAVVGVGEQEASPRSGAAVALFRPTPTPTPLPTATPTPQPTETPTPAPIIATNPPPPDTSGGGTGGGAPTGGGFGANRPGAGSILSGFEYGGHVTGGAGSARALDAMRRAGMTWIKVQIRYAAGMGADVAAGEIGAAKANGFKILVGTVGSPNELGSGGSGYVDSYVNWLAGIAAQGADAIEVWNEPNLDREWPTGQISGAGYADMLRRAYNAIKSANGSTIVISGAPAPTGAEAAYPGAVMNDDRWLREVVNAGGLQFLDCVGVHYNEGIIPPSATSGDPRPAYYTRYFPSMVNIYSSITGGQKPLCFTELGYLSAEGYPPLPEFFSWAQNVTVSQQAAWLAEAAALSSQNGNIRLMIVWNVDATGYGSDPQAGYAMIRPDGSCPACDALAGAR